ncbi:golgi transport complex component Cog5 [Microthyrium microscopicum]|uniref:Conserved oligomeric Golgi complex subunit 5 n=1 Tax=Microthyrium microscopicum TaxID=703497 RepID=A0A6A6U532_9PEZI|nr:golgi transport complex component Cog5 [Microthyrium microscopicum]
MAEDEPSYIDYETFLDPSFSAIGFANKLVLATNDPSDNQQDLSTPLSKVLFDVQEIDTHIDSLTTKSALPLLEYTQTRAQSSQKILDEVEGQVASLTEAYNVLKKEVVERYEAAEQVRLVAERLCQTVRLARGLSRTLLLGRQLEVQMAEYNGTGARKGGDHRAMVRSANTLASIKTLLLASKPGEEGHGLERVAVVNTLRTELILPSERLVASRAQQIIREFSMSNLLSSNIVNQPSGAAPTFSQNEESKSRVFSALLTLFLLSPIRQGMSRDKFEPTLVISTLQEYLQTALKSSLAAMSRSLATLPTLDRTLLEVSARCQNILALESLLSSAAPPSHPAFETSTADDASKESSPSNFLQPLLQSLDTSSLPSFFWRSLASALSPRVQEILTKGGVSARTLRNNKDRVREAIRSCVDRGSQIPGAISRRTIDRRSWEREAAVMVASVIGPLGR